MLLQSINYLQEYKILGIYILICFSLSSLLVVITSLLAPSNPNKEKLSSYECGFEPFHDARIKFDVHFYLVAILFIIFDLEIVFLFPWAYCAGSTFSQQWITPVFFLFILGLGLFHEWKEGALVWK